MVQRFTTRQQIAALKRNIELMHHSYMYALQEGQPNSCLDAITNKIKKLMTVLDFVHNIHIENKQNIRFAKKEFVENYKHNIEVDNVLMEVS